jgi:hypothetical protein
MGAFELDYDRLPGAVKQNISADQWDEARRAVIPEGQPIPETTIYINLKNGQCLQHSRGEAAPGPLLATHDLAGGGGKESAQFHTEPAGAHTAPPADATWSSERAVTNLKARIEPHMPIICSDQEQLGVVDHLDQGNSIKLTKDQAGQHHWVPMTWVARVDQAVYLDRPSEQARQEWSASPLQSIRREGPRSGTG